MRRDKSQNNERTNFIISNPAKRNKIRYCVAELLRYSSPIIIIIIGLAHLFPGMWLQAFICIGFGALWWLGIMFSSHG